MAITGEMRKNWMKDIFRLSEEIQYMVDETVDLEKLSDDELFELHDAVIRAWWELIKKSD